jgi:hypothetical protein
MISLVNQFASMQQQMFEQSQQTMTAILRSRHETEVGLVRDEMAQIRELSRELQGLSQQLAGRTIEEVRGISDQPVDAANQLAETAALPQQAEDVVDQSADQHTANQAAEADVDTASATPDSVPVHSQTETDVDPADDVGTSMPKSPASENPVTDNPAAASPEIGDDSIDDDSEEDDPHDWLSHRIAAIEKERTSRWQKITRLLTGSTADDRMT